MIKRLYIFIILLAFSSCLKEKYLDNEFVKHIVVEGHISQDDVARVMLTFNMVPSEDISEETLRDKIIKYMVVRVTEIVDGVAGTSEELVGSVDARSVRIFGEEYYEFTLVEGNVFVWSIFVEDDIALGIKFVNWLSAFCRLFYAESFSASERHLYVNVSTMRFEFSLFFLFCVSFVYVDINIFAIEFDVTWL